MACKELNGDASVVDAAEIAQTGQFSRRTPPEVRNPQGAFERCDDIGDILFLPSK